MNRNDISKSKLMQVMAKAVECTGDDYRTTCGNLKKANFLHLGGGHYGSAWTHTDIPGWAIKVSGADEGDSFPAYVYWCMANPMPHVPEYKFPVFSTDRQQFMVMMPQYSGCSYDIECTSGEIYSVYRDMSEALAGCAKPVQGPHYEIMFAAQQIRTFFVGKVSFDMHSENVMMDNQTGRMIITDPIHQGDTDSMITQITGVSCVPKPQIWRQAELELEPQSARGVPERSPSALAELMFLFDTLKNGGRFEARDNFEHVGFDGTHTPCYVNPTMTGDLAVFDDLPSGVQVFQMKMPKARQPVDVQLFACQPMLHAKPDGAKPFAVMGLAAIKGAAPVYINGERANTAEMYIIGKELQNVDLAHFRARGRQEITIALFPNIPNFLHDGQALEPIEIKHVHLSLLQAEFIAKDWRNRW